jgi:hypothetical protein
MKDKIAIIGGGNLGSRNSGRPYQQQVCKPQHILLQKEYCITAFVGRTGCYGEQ